MYVTIFLRHPVGVAINTEAFETAKQLQTALQHAFLAPEGLLYLASTEKAEAAYVPVDNIASVEVHERRPVRRA